MKKSRLTVILGLIIASAIVLVGCGNPVSKTYTRDFFAMDTFVTCQIVNEDRDLAEAGLDAIENSFMNIERLTNRFDPQSELALINEKAGIESVKVSAELLNLVNISLTWAQITGGDFNILIGAAMDLWSFGSELPSIPTQDKIKLALAKTDFQSIIVDKADSTIYLPENGMVMDLGGIAKGYATDQAVVALRGLGIENALINAGGNIYAMGSKADGGAWRIGVQDPRDSQKLAEVLEVRDESVVSSGDYQRYFEVDGIRYHHILDPSTGFPARESSGTTVVMKSATIADVLSTAIFVKGPKDGIELVQQLPEVDAALIIAPDGSVYPTESLSNYLATHKSVSQ